MCVYPPSYLDVLQVYFDQADPVRFRQKLNACDTAELGEGGQDAQLMVDNLTHTVACPHQQGHHGLPVLELNVVRKSGETDEK